MDDRLMRSIATFFHTEEFDGHEDVDWTKFEERVGYYYEPDPLTYDC